jgi:hypothetical protein
MIRLGISEMRSLPKERDQALKKKRVAKILMRNEGFINFLCYSYLESYATREARTLRVPV